LACLNILSCLRNVCVTMFHTNLLRVHTERRTPMPAKTTLAGENTCQINIRVQTSDKREHTRPTPAPSVAEKANRTFTVGSSHFVHRSSLRD
jgi:hypothetical protein